MNNKNIRINKSVDLLFIDINLFFIDIRSSITYFCYINELWISIPLELIALLDFVRCPKFYIHTDHIIHTGHIILVIKLSLNEIF
jgi:hypothetical protein